ncbi:hypothetical protein Pcinc_015719 [Petrolisthes cinctipes]|uniref:CUB domain-containing protein n=1 Tax=Petrolisthes cinctipes TaxID=88211 RepID=A0AAE1FTV3_PETCI|nr:hypothetical protein Pcinc_015719 [Petrolisthes cinctipes]
MTSTTTMGAVVVLTLALMVITEVTGVQIYEQQQREEVVDLQRQHHQQDDNRDERRLFNSSGFCNTKNYTNMPEKGVCLSYFSCLAKGGVRKGSCWLGFGTCCVFERTCGQCSNATVTYFTDRHPYSTMLDSCGITIHKAYNVCQLRLDMIKLDLSEPNVEGVCVDQYLQVTGADTQIFTICGSNSGQHLIVPARTSFRPITISIINNNDATVNANSRWNIKVEQLSCNSSDLGTRGTRHLQARYSICVKPWSHCGLSWTPSIDQPSFTITDIYDSSFPLPGFQYDSLCATNYNNTFTDYLMIPGGSIFTPSSTTGIPASIFCGLKFPPEVRASGYQVIFITNDQEAVDNDADNRGFHLIYQEQTNCEC